VPCDGDVARYISSGYRGASQKLSTEGHALNSLPLGRDLHMCRNPIGWKLTDFIIPGSSSVFFV
jgi:hypothetical protein